MEMWSPQRRRREGARAALEVNCRSLPALRRGGDRRGRVGGRLCGSGRCGCGDPLFGAQKGDQAFDLCGLQHVAKGGHGAAAVGDLVGNAFRGKVFPQFAKRRAPLGAFAIGAVAVRAAAGGKELGTFEVFVRCRSRCGWCMEGPELVSSKSAQTESKGAGSEARGEKMGRTGPEHLSAFYHGYWRVGLMGLQQAQARLVQRRISNLGRARQLSQNGREREKKA